MNYLWLAFVCVGGAMLATALELGPMGANLVQRWRALKPAHDPLAALVITTVMLAAVIAVVGFGRVGVVAAAAGALLLPRPLAEWLQQRRAAAIATQLPDALETLANGLRAGQALPQAFVAVATRAPQPTAAFLQPAVERMRLGQAPAVALRSVPPQLTPPDWHTMLAGLEAVASVGGDLSHLFATAAGVMRRRLQVQQRLHTLTAQARMQMAIIAALPLAFLAMIKTTNPQLFAALTGSVLGWAMLGGALLMEYVALRWARTMMRIRC